MSEEMKREIGISINTNINKDALKQAKSEIESFRKSCESDSIKLGIDKKSLYIDTKNFYKAIAAAKDLGKEISTVEKTAPKMLKALEKADIGHGYLGNFKEELKDAVAIFDDKSVVSGVDNIISKISDGFQIVAVDLGERVRYLQDQIAGSIKQLELLKDIGTKTNWSGRDFGSFTSDMDEDALSSHIELLKKLVSYQKELETFSGESFDFKSAPLGSSTKSAEWGVRSLERFLAKMHEYNSQLEDQYKLSSILFKKRQEILKEANNNFWDNDSQTRAIQDIENDNSTYYDENIQALEEYIQRKKNAIQQLQEQQSILFRVDDISEIINNASNEVKQYEKYLQELKNKHDGIDNVQEVSNALTEINLTKVLDALKKIEEAVTNAANAFKPLTDALANENSAINQMVNANIEDLQRLQAEVEETFKNIKILSEKDFSSKTTNVVQQTINAPGGVLKTQRAELKELVKILDQYQSAIEGLNSKSRIFNRVGITPAAQLDFSSFNSKEMLDAIKKATTAGKLDGLADMLDDYKTTIIDITNQINKSYGETVINLNQLQNLKKKDPEIINIDKASADVDGILTEVKSIRDQIDAEIQRIRASFEDIFKFDSLNPNFENIQSITDQIYQQFVELQNKIKALDFKIEVPTDGIAQITQVIAQEGNAAQEATPKKNAFTEANKKVAASMQDTGEAGADAVSGIKQEAEAVEEAYKTIANFSFKENIKVSDNDFEAFAAQIAANKNLKVKQAKATRGALGSLIGGSITFYDPKTLQEIQERYSVRPKEDTEDEVELYRSSYTLIENTAKAEKMAADEAERRAKAVADSNKWLIEQEDLLNKQENKYKAASGAAKPLAGDTALITENASMIPGIDNTIDGLANSIRTRIRDAMGGIITQDAKNEIIKDLNTLANEIQVQQARKYQSTTLRASDLETSRDVYRQYIDALEADAKKANVFDQMSETIGNLKEEVGSFTADNFVNFLDNVKKAQAKFQAEKSKLGQQNQEQKQQEQSYDKLIRLQDKLYDAKKKLEKQEYGSVNEQEWQRKVNEAQTEYDIALKAIQNADKKAEALRRESQLQSEVKAIIDERIKAEEELAWAQREQAENTRIAQETDAAYKERADVIKAEADAEKELAATRKESEAFYKQEEQTRKAQEDAAWAEYRAEQAAAVEKERQINLAFSQKAAEEAAQAERELAQARKETDAYYDAVEKQEKKEADLKAQKELNALYRERSTIISAIIKYNNKANSLKTDKAVQRAKDQLEVEKQKLATIDEEINKYGKLVNQSKIEQQNDRLVSRLYDSNKINGITTEQKQDIEAVNKLLLRRKEVYDNIAGLKKQMNAASGDKEKAAIQEELDDQQTIYRVLTKQLATYQDIALQRKVTGQDNKFKEQDNQNKAQQKIKAATAADKADLESQKQDYEDILNLVNQLFAAQTALHKINIDPTDNVRATEREEEIRKVKELSMLLKDVYGIDIKNLTGSLDKSGLLLQEQKNVLLEKERQYKQDIIDLTAKAVDKEATLQKKQQQQEQQRQNRQNQNYGKAEYNKYAKFYESMNATIRNIEQNGSINQYLDSLVQKYTEAYKKIEAMRKQFAENPDAANDIGLKSDFQDAVVEAEKLRKEINGVFNEAKKFDQVDRFGDVFTLDQFNFDDIKSSLIAFANEVTNGEIKLESFNNAGTQLYGTLNNGSGSVEKITFALREGTNQLYAYSMATGKAKNEWEDFKAKTVTGAKNLIGMYVGFQEGVQAFRAGVNYVKEIDLAMTELKKVTDETDASYTQFLEDAASTSSVIGSTISDFTEATANFARLGYSMEESASMAETAIIYKNVADGLDTVEESTESIISTMKAFGIGASDTMGIIDRFNEVGEYLPTIK